MLTTTIHPALLRAPSTDGGTPNNTADPAGFSSLLRQSQACAPQPQVAATPPTAARSPEPADNAPKTPAQNDASASNDTSNEGADAAPEAADAATRGRSAPRTKARDAQPRHGRGEAATPEAAPSATGADAAAGAAQADSNGAAAPGAIDPQIAHWLAAQQRTGPDTNERPTDAGQGTASGAKTDAATARGADVSAADDAKALRGAARERAEPATAFAAALATERAPAEPAASSHTPGNAAPIGALAGPAATGGTAAARETAAPTVVTLPTPIDAPEFAQSLGVQLSVFAKDGVQRAELHLNPAEMGPVSVQIVMEGTQARIDFGADVAATRNAIEAGLPELASALRDAGFTLAGGGVSQQSAGQHGAGGQQTGHGQGRAAARAVSDDTLERVTTAARRLVTPGGVDLYA